MRTWQVGHGLIHIFRALYYVGGYVKQQQEGHGAAGLAEGRVWCTSICGQLQASQWGTSCALRLQLPCAAVVGSVAKCTKAPGGLRHVARILSGKGNRQRWVELVQAAESQSNCCQQQVVCVTLATEYMLRLTIRTHLTTCWSLSKRT